MLGCGRREPEDTGAPVEATREASSADAARVGGLGDGLGHAVACADLDGDGVTDLIAAAPSADDQRGIAELFLGPVGSGPLPAPAARLVGATVGEAAGKDLAVVGDVDADGFTDVLVGAKLAAVDGVASGVAYLVRGPLVRDLDLALAHARLVGEGPGDEAGVRVHGGDLDGDGLPELLVGAAKADAAGTDSGAAYVVSGTPSGDVALATAHARLSGEAPGDLAGRGLAAVGDVDGDGVGDVVVGAPGHAGGGAVYLALGPLEGEVSLAGAIRYTAGAPGDLDGVRVAAAGDLDGDGHADWMAGATGEATRGPVAGAVYVVRGRVAPDGTSLEEAPLVLLGEAPESRLGFGLHAPGDVDGDGAGDLLVGAYGYSGLFPDAGAAYLVLSPPDGVLDVALAATVRFRGDQEQAQLGVSVASGDLDVDGRLDVVIGADGGLEGRARGGDDLTPGSVYVWLDPLD